MIQAVETGTVSAAQVFSTRDVDEPDKVDFWRQRFGSIWGTIDVRSEDRPRLYGRVETTMVADLRFNRIDMEGMHFDRPANQIRTEPFFALGFPQQGCAVITKRGQQSAFEPGQVYLIRHGEPDVTAISGLYQTLNVQIPARMIEERVGRLSQVRAWSLEQAGLARVVRSFIGSIWNELPLASPGDCRLLTDQLCDLLAQMLRAGDPVGTGVDSASMRACRVRAQAVIDELAGDVSLSPDGVADAVGVSTSYLHKIFAGAGTSVMREVRRVRVDRARRLLGARNLDLPLSEVGLRCGFASQQDFSRVFRQDVGSSPTQYRTGMMARIN